MKVSQTSVRHRCIAAAQIDSAKYGYGSGVPIRHKRKLCFAITWCDESASSCGSRRVLRHDGLGNDQRPNRAVLRPKRCRGPEILRRNEHWIQIFWVGA